MSEITDIPEFDPKLLRKSMIWVLSRELSHGISFLDGQMAQSSRLLEDGERSRLLVDGEIAHTGPWVCIDFEGGSQYAIWKSTGCVFRLDSEGAVEENVIYDPRTT
jgi:hypothetical protein